MKHILLNVEYRYSLVSVPTAIADSAKAYQDDFFKWLYDKNNDHGYWHELPEADWVDGDHRLGLRYGGDAFVKWLNELVLHESEEKAVFVPGGHEDMVEHMPMLCF